ncbi:MAG: hypothetical protein J6P93_04870, partial [Alphaproteobacteria bacterium]|nr:hypothetical protein [Alphaproteobacteria bacterium]
DCNSSSLQITNVDRDECKKCKNRMWSSLYGGRCLLPANPSVNYWSSVPEEECEKLPNHYSVSDGGSCFYCKGNFDKTTGVCNTTDCHRDSMSKVIYGLSETDCVACGGSHWIKNIEGGKVSGCTLP